MLSLFQTLCVFLMAILIARVLIHIWTYRRFYYLGHLIPGPHGSLGEKALYYFNFLGSLEKVTKTVNSIFENSRENPIFKIWMGVDLMVFIVEPDTVNKIFREHLQKADVYKALGPYTAGKSLIDQNDIHVWKNRRQMLLIKTFSFGALESHFKVFIEESKILVDKMEPLAKSGAPFEPFGLTGMAGFATSVRTISGLDLKIQENYQHNDPYLEGYAEIFKMFMLQCAKPWIKIKLIYYLFGYKAQESNILKKGDKLLGNIFNKVRENLKDMESSEYISNHISNDHLNKDSHEKMESFVETVIKAQMKPSMPNNQVISDKDLGHEILLLLGTGDTSKLTNSFILILLAIYPDIQQEVYNEIIDVLGDDPNVTPTNSQLNELHLLTRVIKETLRLFPAAPVLGRKAIRDIQVGEYTIPKGATLVAYILEIHRDPRHWPNPHQFDPDRFLPSEVAKRSPNAFMPFSLGPRNCIGQKYAMMNIKTTISTILRRYRILPGDKCKRLEDIRFHLGLTMIPLPGNDIRIEIRKP